MKTSESYLPEGSYMVQPAVRQAFSTLGALRQAQDEGRILEAVAQRCTAAHDLLFDLGIAQGRRVALHPFLKPVVKSCIGTDEKAVIDGNFYTAQNENTISCLLPELLKVLK